MMPKPCPPVRTASGAVLYLVLAGIAAIAVASTTVAVRAVSDRRLARLDEDDLQCEVLRADAVHLAAAWLRRHGGALTTPVDEPYRGLRILHSRAEWQGVA